MFNFVADDVFASSSHYQLGQVVVSASKVEEYIAQTGSSVVVVTNEEIEKKQYKTVLEAVQNQVGLSTASSGVTGGSASLFIRGADSGHTLVMMDGVRLYDPISTNATYDLSNLTLDNVERIEIIKGPQSSLYGSDAMGGIVNIITKKGKGEPKGFAYFSLGSKDTYTEKLGTSGKFMNLNYSIEASRQDSKALSVARDGADKDKYERTTVSSKVGYNFSENLELGFQALYLRAQYDLDDGAWQDDPNYWMKYENILLTFFGNHNINDLWSHNFEYSWLRNIRQNFDDSDSIDVGEYYRAWYKGWTQEVNWQHNFDAAMFFDADDNISDVIVAGAQWSYEAGREQSTYGDLAKVTSHNEGYFIENKFGLNDKFFNTMSLRLDDHSRFGTHTTGKLTLSYLFDSKTRIKASYGTGFNAPSLYQLFSDYGDTSLKAEKSRGVDVGLEQELLNGKLFFSGVFFNNRFKDLIEFDSWKVNANAPWGYGMYVNRGSARTKGFETECRLKATDKLTLGYSFVYTEAINLQNKYQLVRRPNNVHNLTLNYNMDKLNINFAVTRNMRIYDTFVFGQEPRRLKDYTVCDLALSYKQSESTELFAKVENIFDETYQEVNGYTVKPAFLTVGVKINF